VQRLPFPASSGLLAPAVESFFSDPGAKASHAGSEPMRSAISATAGGGPGSLIRGSGKNLVHGKPG
jgi:hypothetical protein